MGDLPREDDYALMMVSSLVSGSNTAHPKGHYHNCDPSLWWDLLCAGRSGSSHPAYNQ